MGRKVVEPSLNGVIRLLLGILVPQLGIRILPWEVTQFFISAVSDTIKYREQHNIVRNDFMQQLIQLKNEGKVQNDDDEVDKSDLKKEFSTNSTTLTEKNGSNMAESLGEPLTVSYCLHRVRVLKLTYIHTHTHTYAYTQLFSLAPKLLYAGLILFSPSKCC
jgi:hypothetical protein